MGLQIIEGLGGSSRCVTLLTFTIHFLHSLFSVVNFLSWVQTPGSRLTHSTQMAYLSLTVVCCLFYFFGASVFYMWAWRFPEPEEVAKRRRVYGVGIHLFFCDLPIFIIETRIVWRVQFPAAIMGFNYVLTCVSLSYSTLRVWFFLMVRLIKFHLPTARSIGANYTTRTSLAARRAMDESDYTGHGGATPPSTAAGHTIFLNRNAGLHSDDRVSATRLYYTPDTDRDRRDVYYGPSPSRYYSSSSDDLSISQRPIQHGCRRSPGANVYSPQSAAPPFRI
ncbi:conserved hypothetical protein [Leishmania infantum JPCM5]|uniref:Uncharacterized protein n=2 Tax=Leishmania infantum TaxID=5671 RepID=A4IB69_LEIIN|nr:conserved hypothetical protein [Leishmania infantum JPCM5]CAC9544140.1 hypothetical_protein_-_conserved [Leishmania infantum]CAM72083.1 conserved hypothetical protein [Leishmania infantum JPCM5]SUZ45998.1 hypothetical_protein_-_conserved [Leishmania infantum]|eukprot:XP_001468988.1 conserved hypothetical protein [Leishmania infantum JPCM5]